ncbi:MAG: hypothetical protein FWC47_08710 [Oscillospiraceae bacterium]|nr:hypothetical protein [Oscillospiraceae bacterium]
MKLRITFFIIKLFLLITFIIILFANLNNIFNYAYDQFNRSIDDKFMQSITDIKKQIDEVNTNVKIEYVEGINSLNKTALSKTFTSSIQTLSDINKTLTDMPINERYKDSQKNLQEAVSKNIDLYNTMELLFTDSYNNEAGSQLIQTKNDLIFLYQQCRFKTIQFSLPDTVSIFVSTFIDEMNKQINI